MIPFNNENEYLSYLEEKAVLPEGFHAGSISFSFQPAERVSAKEQTMRLTALLLDDPTASFGAVFTKNAFPGHPVALAKELLDNEVCSGVVINNKISNVACPGGKEDSEEIIEAAKDVFRCGGFLFPSSTGIIGWRLPVKDIIENLSPLKASLQSRSILSAACGIMTTDRFPKVRSVNLGEGRIVGICKGAGMIEPNLATMLVFIVTDIRISRDDIREMLPAVCSTTFNRISVDGDQSTSDSVFLFSSNKKPPVKREVFQSALTELCRDLSEDLVRNGEGTAHVIEVAVSGAEDESMAAGIGKSLVNSPLTKAAIYGNDPNVGRFTGHRRLSWQPGYFRSLRQDYY